MGVAEYKSFLHMQRVPFDAPNEGLKLVDLVQEPSQIYQKPNFLGKDLLRFARRSPQPS